MKLNVLFLLLVLTMLNEPLPARIPISRAKPRLYEANQRKIREQKDQRNYYKNYQLKNEENIPNEETQESEPTPPLPAPATH